MDDLKKYFTVKQVSKKLDVTEKWVRDLIKAKQIKATKIGRWRVYPEDLESFIKSRSNIVS
ncbi:MAG: helix-turn-helix domain-containing protein [Candidatus Omnitrophica bacterium]|nr:helix-turn-helix domain-containing protein [Candidatus Omnitrophota bacterium]